MKPCFYYFDIQQNMCSLVLRPSLFWDVTQCRLVVGSLSFGSNCCITAQKSETSTTLALISTYFNEFNFCHSQHLQIVTQLQLPSATGSGNLFYSEMKFYVEACYSSQLLQQTKSLSYYLCDCREVLRAVNSCQQVYKQGYNCHFTVDRSVCLDLYMYTV